MTRPIASLSLDLDNKWAYMRTHGVAGWEEYPSYLDVVVPRVLRCCLKHNLRITCFVVGRDAGLMRNRGALATLAVAGHEIGNHSLNHYPWMHTLPRDQVEAEIAVAEELIEEATGQRPIGFRAPAYSISDTTLEILAQRGYHYDASRLPTFLGPLARWYVRHTSSPEAAKEAGERQLFGSLREGFRPIRPHDRATPAGPILEIPVTTFPLVRVPIHMTYLMFLARRSTWLARSYFEFALAACRMTNVAPSLLLHPLDFLGTEDVADMSFFPGMNMPLARKLQLISYVLSSFQNYYDVQPLSQLAASLRPQLSQPMRRNMPFDIPCRELVTK